MSGQGAGLAPEHGAQGLLLVGQVRRELPADPGGRVQHLSRRVLGAGT